MESNIERLCQTPANKLSLDELNYVHWMLNNSPESPCYHRSNKKNAEWFLNCALVNIICGKDVWGGYVNL